MSDVDEACRQSVSLLKDLQECLNNVASRLESKKDVPHVERFPEKNLLTHDCIGLYDKWYKAQTNWVYLACHGHGVDMSRCSAVRAKFEEKNKKVSQSMKDIFQEATNDELAAYDRLLTQVETKTRPVLGDPFHKGGAELN